MGEDFGEVMFMDFGLSGPIILTLSRMIVRELHQDKKIKITLDLKPALDEQKLDNRLIRELDNFGKGKIIDVLRKLMPSAMIPFFAKKALIPLNKPCNQISSKERKKLGFRLKNLEFDIIGHRSFKEAIITAGGVSLKEIRFADVELTDFENYTNIPRVDIQKIEDEDIGKIQGRDESFLFQVVESL